MTGLLQQGFLETVERHPSRVAVWARGQSLTYAALEERSNQLARFLVERGVSPGDRVGLFLPKSVDSIVAMLGVLKAGAAYVPIDPQSPPKRAAYILDNCTINVLITTQERTTVLEGTHGNANRSCLISGEPPAAPDPQLFPWSVLDGYSRERPVASPARASDLAYILYTSGSTGDPKGVMLTHRNARAFVDWCADTFRIRPEDRLSNHAPLHFDLSVFDVYNTLKAGATLYMVDEGTALFPATLAAFIETHALTVWYSVPSALTGLLLHGGLETRDFSALRLILFAGEVFPMKYLRQLAGRFPRTNLYNLYGPTETNVCTYYQVERARLEQMNDLPIGRACETTEVFAVDEEGRTVPDGERGELWVRGPTVTPGYWGDPDRTARTVIQEGGERVYRTGDLVTLCSDGNYEFHGRRDNQIKSRGYRIELGEIETALLDHPGIREAAVLPVPDPEIGNRLLAFVVPERAGLTSLEVQRHCSTRLPKYMIPETVQFRDQLPKTSTGKVDRTSLASRSGGRDGAFER